MTAFFLRDVIPKRKDSLQKFIAQQHRVISEFHDPSKNGDILHS